MKIKNLIYVFEVSPITVALPAIKFKKKKHIPIIINIQDLWPENIIAVAGITNSIIIGLINIMVNYIYKHCDIILTASPSFVAKIQERVEDKDKVKYWPQYSTVAKTNEEVDIYDKDYFNIVFTGNIGEAQGIDLAIEAARELKEEKICWHFVGDGRNRAKLENLVREDADAALLILKPNPVFEMTIPAKLQTYLACGVPILGCVSGEGKRIIEESGAGIVSDSVSVSDLIKVCREFLDLKQSDLDKYKDMAFCYGKDKFNKNTLIIFLEELMDKVLCEGD